MRIYLGGCCIHDFDRQRAFGAGYMAENSWVSQVYQRYDEINMEQGGESAMQNKKDKKLPIVPLRQGDKIYGSALLL